MGPQDILELIERFNAIDQVTMAALPASGKECPECERKFAVLSLAGMQADCCPFCRSIWFDAGELAKLAGLSQDVPSSTLASRASKYRCPVCRKPMEEYLFQQPHNLLVDRCAEHGVYLESGELKRLASIL